MLSSMIPNLSSCDLQQVNLNASHLLNRLPSTSPQLRCDPVSRCVSCIRAAKSPRGFFVQSVGPSDSCFSIGVFSWHWVYSGSSNRFFPITQKQMELFAHRFAVNEVSPEQIQLEETT